MSNFLISGMRPKNSNWEIGLKNLCETIKNELGDSPIIVELGSYMGESSIIFADFFPNGKIYCIDSWVGGFDDSDTCNGNDYKIVEEQFDLRIKSYNNIIKLKGLSTDFKIECDLVYIDACHKYECVKNDIIHWKPLTKKIMAGHDYCVDEQQLNIHQHIKGVRVAVDEMLGSPDMTFIDWSWFKKL
jgi:hypothetical protein